MPPRRSASAAIAQTGWARPTGNPCSGQLADGVAALIADSLDQPAPVTMLASLTVVAHALDVVNGWVAAHRSDGEVRCALRR